MGALRPFFLSSNFLCRLRGGEKICGWDDKNLQNPNLSVRFGQMDMMYAR